MLPLLQGDVVYEETLTEAVLKTATALLQYAMQVREQRAPLPAAPPKMILAMEKRWCFTLRDMDSCAPAFDYFLSFLEMADGGGGGSSGGSVAGSSVPPPGGKAAAINDGHARQSGTQPPKLLRGRRLDVDSIPQRLQGYDRGPDLELWELTLL